MESDVGSVVKFGIDVGFGLSTSVDDFWRVPDVDFNSVMAETWCNVGKGSLEAAATLAF